MGINETELLPWLASYKKGNDSTSTYLSFFCPSKNLLTQKNGQIDLIQNYLMEVCASEWLLP